MTEFDANYPRGVRAIPHDFTLKDITSQLKLSEKDAKLLMKFIGGREDPTVLPQVRKWYERLHSRPRFEDAVLEAANVLMDAHGIEGLTPDGRVRPIAEYVNMGDTYSATLLYCYDRGMLHVTSWGDFLEEWERENNDSSED